MGKALDITDAAFEREVLHSTLPVLIDLWAPWCGPCKAIAPIVEEVAIEYTGQLKVMKLDVDVNPRTPVAPRPWRWPRRSPRGARSSGND